MADKRNIKRQISILRRVKTWQLILLLLLALLITATFMRLNNIGMIERRTAVLSSDKQDDAEVTRARLFDLQRYASAHMNADSGPVYLEEQYKRDTDAAIQAASQSMEGDNINTRADRVCKPQFAGNHQAYVQCFASELAKAPSGSNAPDKADLPSASLYRHEFSSPLWSPDFAGFGTIVCGLLALLIIARLIGLMVLRLLVRRQYQHA